jgi:hypothetical protein
MSVCHIPTYEKPEEIDIFVRELEADAARMLPGLAQQSVLSDIARLRSYANMKRLQAKPRPIAALAVTRHRRRA